MGTVAALPASTRRRWDSLAADQLRAELARVNAECDALKARVERLSEELYRANDCADFHSSHVDACHEQVRDLLVTARRAGISLNVRPIGLTRDGQIGLMQVAA